MNYCIEELSQLSGSAAGIYTIRIEGEDKTEFSKFIENHKEQYKDEIKDIVARLKIMGKEEGAREHYFKDKEGCAG
ncbi:MAG: T9SS type A sorting domain-containing protein [Bacteroidetes bacterium]|nr:T9SS type A sorting domain-containing protein [Bacteroidota bacterium]